MLENIEYLYDTFLNIDTLSKETDNIVNRKIFTKYQPTHYSFLEFLFKKYPFSPYDCLVDFGAGKGRPIIMAAYYSCKHIIGYEYDESRTQVIENNIINFKRKFKIEFNVEIFNMDASNAIITPEMNKFFFFNPFHLKIYIRILNKILLSIQTSFRSVYIFLYGPDDSVIKYIDSLGVFRQIESNRLYHKQGTKLNVSYEYVIYENFDK